MTATQTPRFEIYRWSADSDSFTRGQMDTSHANIESRVGGFYAGAGAPPTPAAQYTRSVYLNTTTSKLFYFIGEDVSGSWIALNDFIDNTTRSISIGNGTATTINNVTITNPGGGGSTLTIPSGGSLVTSGAHSITLVAGGTTSVTLPNGGTLISTSNLSSITSVGTLSAGDIPTSLLTGTTLPSSIVTSSLTTVGTLSAGAIPTSLLTGTTLPASIVTSSLTSVGTIATGVWNGSVVAGQYGGTGVANTGKTITIGGNLTTAGAFATTITVTGTTTVTLPTTGTLSTLAGTETLTNKSLSDTTSFVINASDATKRAKFSTSSIATSTTRTFTLPNVDGTIVTTGDTGSVSSAMISAVDYTKVTGLQTWTDSRYYTETEIAAAHVYQWAGRTSPGTTALTNARQVYIQADAPASAQEGDLWFDL